MTRKTRKIGGSALKLSPNVIQSLVNKMKRYKNTSKKTINRKLGYMKIYNNFYKGKFNTKKKSSTSSDYNENVEVVNTTTNEWKLKPGVNEEENIPQVLLPERKKKATFIRISSKP